MTSTGRAADGGNLAGTGVVTGTTDDYQPAVSPDGTRLCFTQQGADKDIFTVDHRGRLPRGRWVPAAATSTSAPGRRT